ncbi:hypothetical protein GCM10009801_25370 [Streptomyces albiaxialis]|uniref:Ricin B lectin domain-containing protein n=1 Tax=Streptomyces albiaxialis TaxID=329523 RepID=A0ABN2VU69_9ACTN
MDIPRPLQRTLTSAGAFVVVGGVVFGLTSAPASAAPVAPTSAASASSAKGNGPDDVQIQGWHIKNAKNVRGGPSTNRNCIWVRKNGGSVTLGKVCFRAKGDKFWVKDYRSDGMHIVMRAMYSGNPQTKFDCRDYKGKRAGWTVCKFSRQMKENRRININALAYKGNDLKYAGRTVTVNS